MNFIWYAPWFELRGNMAQFIALSHKAYNRKNSEIGMKPQNNANGE